MDGKRHNPSVEAGTANLSQDNATASVISIEQLQRLVRLLDNSDVSELELKRAGEGTQLVLRKAKVPDNNEHPVERQYVPASENMPVAEVPDKILHKVLVLLVGTCHIWSKT